MDKTNQLKELDEFGLLKVEDIKINSLDDIFANDHLGIFDNDDNGLFDMKHVPKNKDINKTDFVAQRKQCKDFNKYEQQFKDIHTDLKIGKRKLVPYQEKQLNEIRTYFVHNGMLLYLESINNLSKDRFHKNDGRTRIIFENGTESNMKLRSLGKNLLKNGKAVTSILKEYDGDIPAALNYINDLY